MSNLIVRTARKDYVCDCCKHIIKAGTEYIDNVVLKYGNVVKHERYHDECPDEGDAARLFNKIVAAEGNLPVADTDGVKYSLHGIVFINGELYAFVTPWARGMGGPRPWSKVSKWRDADGNLLSAKNLQKS